METTHIQSQQNKPKAIEEQQGSTSSPSPNPYSNPQPDPDEINLLEYVYVLVKNKWWIIGAMVLGLVLGYVAAKMKGPTYVTEVVIAAKENENKSTPNLSSFGAFSGLVASQLNIGGNPGLDKIELILGSRKFSAEMIEKYNLLPEVYKIQNPEVYKKFYDTTRKEWKSEFKKPNMLSVGAGLKGKYLKKEVNKNSTMTISVESKDSTFSDTLLSKYIEYLNLYIKNSVQTDARENVSYLEKQLTSVADPLVREKLQGLIANELEKEMLVSKEAFKVVDPPIRSYVFKVKNMYPAVFGIGLGSLVMIFIIIAHVIVSAPKTQEDKLLLKKIKSSLLF